MTEKGFAKTVYLLDVYLQHVLLYLSHDATKDVGNRQPQEHIDVAGKPVAERMVKAIKHTESKGKRTQDSKNDEVERANGIDAKR